MVNAEKAKEVTMDPAALELLALAEEQKLETVWDRQDKMQPQCGYGELGLCCRICMQGPCRINPFGDEPKIGICGARDYTIVARNLIRMISAGCAAHSDHGRHLMHTLIGVAEGHALAYKIKDEDKLKAVAQRIGLEVEGKDTLQLAKEVAEAALEDYSRQTDEPATWAKTMLPKKRVELLDSHDVLPSNIDRTICEIMHRTHIGVDADPVSLVFAGLKCSIADLSGEHISTDVSDILFGTPKLVESEANLGVIKEDYVNIAMHGHNPILSEVILDVADELEEEAKSAGAQGINIVGICCTSNELMMRHGVPLATNFASQELAIMTGALDAMIIDYQCIMPSVGLWAQCFHTKLISTMPICHVPLDMHIEFHEDTAADEAKKIVRVAIESYQERIPDRVHIPDIKHNVIAGFSVEEIKNILSKFNPDNPMQYLADKIKDSTVLGICAVVGCNNVKIKHDYGHMTIAKEMIKNNILVVSTGCASGAYAKLGLMRPEATEEYAGDSLKAFLTELGEKMGLGKPLPPVWHMGSCVDNSRISDFGTELANTFGVDMHQLPVVASAPEAMSEKAVVIGSWFVTIGWPTHVGVYPYIRGSGLINEIAEKTAKDVYGGFFIFEPDPNIAAEKLVNIIKWRRWRLMISPDEKNVYWDGTAATTAEKPSKEVTAEGEEATAVEGGSAE